MKNKSKNTPGPWDVYHNKGMVGESEICWGSVRIASVDSDAPNAKREEGWMPEAEGKANAALIAASPDMLSVLQELVALIGDPDGATLDEAYDKAVAVIAKAKGEA